MELLNNLSMLECNGQVETTGTICSKCGKLLHYVVHSKSATLYSDPMTMLQNMYKSQAMPSINNVIGDEQDEKDSFNWYHC
jgi:hypothetical protein